MTAFGPGAWYKIEGRMDRHMYTFILENFVWSTMQNYNLDSSKSVFQHDNDPKHTNKIMQEWLASQPFQPLQWPAQSPDLKPDKHLWALLKQRLNKFMTLSRGIQELWERVFLVYPKFNEHDCMAFYQGMPQTINIVLKSRNYY